MSRIAMEEIAGRVRGAFERSPLARSVRNVTVEPADDLDDDTLLRVRVSLHRPEKVDVAVTNEVVRAVRQDLMADDDRFFIFQFPEAA